jgi:hypothetical protein
MRLFISFMNHPIGAVTPEALRYYNPKLRARAKNLGERLHFKPKRGASGRASWHWERQQTTANPDGTKRRWLNAAQSIANRSTRRQEATPHRPRIA